VPPPDFTVKQLQEEGLTGTCEIQVCRSCGPCELKPSILRSLCTSDDRLSCV
jgi:hypothetical protein